MTINFEKAIAIAIARVSPFRITDQLNVREAVPNMRHSRRVRIVPQRTKDMRSFWDNGETLQQIGDRYNLSRERVRQLFMKAYGETPISPRYIATAYKKGKNKHQYREKRALNYYGTSYDVVHSLGDPYQKGSIPHAFKSQKNNAKKRGIAWNLSLVEWADIWKRSGHLSERGLGKGRYVMSRIADQGGYSVDNVVIKTHSENSAESRAMDRARGAVPLYEYNGEKFTISELSAKCGLIPSTLRQRMKTWSVEKAVNTPKSSVGRWAVKQ